MLEALKVNLSIKSSSDVKVQNIYRNYWNGICIHCVSISKKHRKLILVCFGRMDRKCNRNSSNEAEDRLTYISLPKWFGILFIINDLQLVITSSVNAIITDVLILDSENTFWCY